MFGVWQVLGSDTSAKVYLALVSTVTWLFTYKVPALRFQLNSRCLQGKLIHWTRSFHGGDGGMTYL